LKQSAKFFSFGEVLKGFALYLYYGMFRFETELWSSPSVGGQEGFEKLLSPRFEAENF
jgi:hypothetical protein